MRVLVNRLPILADPNGHVGVWEPAGQPAGAEVSAELGDLYAAPRSPWLRAVMVSTLDGAAAGADGRSGSINNTADKRVFDTLRGLADAVVVGAGTARAEGYGPAAVPVVLVSRRGQIPTQLRDCGAGAVWLGTCASSPGLASARRALGEDQVLVAGQDDVDLAGLVAALHARGLRQLLCEGGPALLASMLDVELVDELCLTLVPRMVGGPPGRIVSGPELGVPLELGVLLEEEGTLLGRWLTARTASGPVRSAREPQADPVRRTTMRGQR